MIKKHHETLNEIEVQVEEPSDRSLYINVRNEIDKKSLGPLSWSAKLARIGLPS